MINVQNFDVISVRREISASLKGFKNPLSGVLSFDVDAASKLGSLETAASASSVVPIVTAEGDRQVAQLEVIALRPGDGTGSTEGFPNDLARLTLPRGYEFDPGLVPKHMGGIAIELALPLLEIHQSGRVTRFAGLLEVMGMAKAYRIVKIAKIGVPGSALKDEKYPQPVVYEVLSPDWEGGKGGESAGGGSGRRLALYNNNPGALVIAGIITATYDDLYHNRKMFDGLGAVTSRPVSGRTLEHI